MKRRTFVKNSSLGLMGMSWSSFKSEDWKDVVIGHGTHRYKVDLKWGALNASLYPVQDCHEMVIDKQGRIFLLTNHTKNNILIYDTKGSLIDSWGTTYPGAHGLTIREEGGEEFLYITDTERHEVIKTTLAGREVLVLPYPKDSGKYESANQYAPTETAIADNGDIYVADGIFSNHLVRNEYK